jgi:tRNA threonylcarbamoyladenosine dehydratase
MTGRCTSPLHDKLQPGAHSAVEPLLPIPNRTVKRSRANDSEHLARESRSAPGYPKSKCPITTVIGHLCLCDPLCANNLPLASPTPESPRQSSTTLMPNSSENTQHAPRAFSGVDRLLGNGAFNILRNSSATVIGIGGVGSWAAEAFARHGIGHITLVDLDSVAESNINRQIHALQESIGRPKVDVMAERIRAINPECSVVGMEDFATPDNVVEVLASRPDVVIDCTDQTSAKVALAQHCLNERLPLFMAGAAGGRTDPTRIRHADLADAQGDALLARVRSLLRKGEGGSRFSAAAKMGFGIVVVYSAEPMRLPEFVACDEPAAPKGLSCAGYGSSVCVTAPFGFALAACAIEHLLERRG